MATGDSYSAVQQAALSEAAMRRAALSEALSRLSGAGQNMQQTRFNERAFKNQKEQQAIINELNRQRLIRGDRAFEYNKRQDSIDRGWGMTQDTISNLLRLKEISARNAPIPESENQFSEAWEAIGQGLITKPEDVDRLYSQVPPEGRERLKTYLGTLVQEEEGDNEQIRAMADSLNAQIQGIIRSAGIANVEKKKKEALKNQGGFFRWSDFGIQNKTVAEPYDRQLSYYPTAPTEMILRENPDLNPKELETFLANTMKNRTYASNLAFDPKTKQFVPNIRRRGTAPVTPNAPAAQPTQPGTMFDKNSKVKIISKDGARSGFIPLSRLEDYMNSGDWDLHPQQ